MTILNTGGRVMSVYAKSNIKAYVEKKWVCCGLTRGTLNPLIKDVDQYNVEMS